MRKTIHLFAFWALNTFFALSIHAQTKDAKTAITPLPMYKDTGNPQQDNERYAADKKAWAEANPDVYNTTTNLSKPNTAAPMPAADNTAPLTKVPTHPVAKGYIEKSATEVNKEEPQTNNTSSNAGKVNAIPNNAVPTGVATFPTYINTGKPDTDNANLALRKQEWINKHAEYPKKEYSETSPTNYATPNPKSIIQATTQTKSVAQSLPNFPEYIDTGNAENDMVDYVNRKDKWIEQNKALYYSPPAQKHIISREELDRAPEVKRATILNNLDKYIIE